MANKKKKNYGNTRSIIIVFGMLIVSILCYRLFAKETPKFSFSFNEKNIKVKIGEIRPIDYAISGENIQIEWKSSNKDIIVDDNGMIYANNYGQAVITGIATDGKNTVTSTCTVTSYTGDIDVSIDKINLNTGYLLMNGGSTYDNPFTIEPANAYIESIEYYSNNEVVALFDNNSIKANKEGSAIISLVVNKDKTKDLTVIVSSNVKQNGFVKKVDSVTLSETELTMNIGNTKKLTYQVNPSGGYVEKIEWTSSNNQVATVNKGEIKAIDGGEAIIKLSINDSIEASVKVVVNKPTPTPKPSASNETIIIDKSPKSTINVGETTDIIAHINPETSDKTIKYISSNTQVATVDQNGIIKGVGKGKTTITLFIGNSNTKYIHITVGSANTTYTWGYQSSNAKPSSYAGKSFFQNLASKGRGSFNGNTYNISSSIGNFSYNLDTSELVVNGYKNIKVRVFYPIDTNLSSANTTVYMGGDGEMNFGGYFSTISANPSTLPSSGILILVAEGNNTSFDADSAIFATKFVQAFTNQKSGVKNSILGFSTGGKYVMEASNKFNYVRTIIFSSWCPDTSSPVNVKNKEILYFLPNNDSLYRLGKDTLVELRNYGYKNVTMITNSSELLNMFNGSGFKIINPGTGMRSGHVSANVGLSGIIAYAND